MEGKTTINVACFLALAAVAVLTGRALYLLWKWRMARLAFEAGLVAQAQQEPRLQLAAHALAGMVARDESPPDPTAVTPPVERSL